MKVSYILTYLFEGVILIGIAIFVWANSPRRITTRTFALFNLSIGWWSFFTVFMITASNENAGTFWDRFCLMGTIFIPTMFIHFTLAFLSLDKSYKKFLFTTYLFSFLCLLLNTTPLFVKTTRPMFSFNYYTVPGIMYHVFLFYFVSMTVFGLILIYKKMNQASENYTEKQIKYFFWSTLIGYAGGGTNFLPVYGIYSPFIPYVNIGILLYACGMTYILLRLKFLDIEVIIKKTLVFAGLFGVIMAAISVITVITQGYLGQALGIGPMTRQILSVLIAMALFDPTRKYLTRLTDSYLFQKKEDFKVILNRLAKNIVTILDLQAVGETVLNTLHESLRLETGAVLIRNEKGGEYSILSSFNLNGLRKEFPVDSEYIRYFSDPGQIVNLENLEEKKNYPDAVRLAMDSLKAVIAVPLFVQSGLAGLLLMGRKKSDQEFTQEEIDYLPTVASQAAIALKNAQLVDDVIHEREEKIIAQNKAEQVNYASSLSHETGNALVGITSTSQNISEGLVQDLRKLIKHCENKLDATLRKRYEEIADKIYRFSKIIEQNSEKVRVIIKTATGGLKDNRSEKEEISFRFVWNHAKKEANIRDIRYDGQMPDPFVVYGNASLLTRVLTNLFINSRDAMINMNGERCIHMEASYRDFEGRQVAWIECWDDGPGIPEELFKKVFEQGFTTKPKPQGPMGIDSGYGQGLYYCRKFIEDFHGGRLWLEKKGDGGSKFVFWIPAAREENGEEK